MFNRFGSASGKITGFFKLMLSGLVQDQHLISHSAENFVVVSQSLVCNKLLKSVLSLRRIFICHSISSYVLTLYRGVRKMFEIL